jgi:enoyl-CoA hydratase
MTQQEILCTKRGAAGFVLLNRPHALNALTPGMIAELEHALVAWAADPSIERVVIRGAGERAFCAGGDIRLVHDLGRARRFAEQRAFYAHEYQVNRRIARYPKPYIALLDGFVMGGGAGVAIHGSHRVVSERVTFSMPEVGIGFFPDVGATTFLTPLPDAMGIYLGATGARIMTGDMIALGLATHHVPQEQFDALASALEAQGDTDAIINRFAQQAPAPHLAQHRGLIRDAFGKGNLAVMLDRLQACDSDFAREALALLRSKCPTSIAVALRQLARAPVEIEEALQLEYRLVTHICRREDFYEGIRCVIIDKGQQPQWAPARLEDVQSADIEALFAVLPDELRFEELA